MHALLLALLVAQADVNAQPADAGVAVNPTAEVSSSGDAGVAAAELGADAGVETASSPSTPDAGYVTVNGEQYRVLQGKYKITTDDVTPTVENSRGLNMSGGQGQDRDAPSEKEFQAQGQGATTVPGVQQAPKFVKGELSVFLGADRVVAKNNRIGVSLGVDRIGSVYYALVNPQVDLRFLDDNKLAIGISVPLRLELFSFENDPPITGPVVGAKNLGHIRKQDYDQPGDFAKILNYVTYGHKEDNLYVNVGQRYASSIGHGTIVRRYAPNIDVDQARVSAQFDAYNDYGGFELLTNDVVEWNLLSGLAFVKPLSFFSDNPTAKSLSIGVSAASDLAAPLALVTDPANGTRQLDASGHLVATRKAVSLFGVDAEVKVLKTRNADIKPYVDYSMLAGGDAGLTVGALGRFNVGDETVNAFRVVLEGRYLENRYQASYFDTFYEVERYVARQVESDFAGVSKFDTKQQMVFAGLGERLGYYAEVSWGVRGNAGVTLALEGNNKTPEKNAVVHLEVPALDWLQFFGSYYKRGFTDFSTFTKLNDNSSIFFAGARLRLLPFLFVNGRAFKTFRVSPESQRYDNTFGFAVDAEIGYEFKREGKTEAYAPRTEETPASETKPKVEEQTPVPVEQQQTQTPVQTEQQQQAPVPTETK